MALLATRLPIFRARHRPGGTFDWGRRLYADKAPTGTAVGAGSGHVSRAVQRTPRGMKLQRRPSYSVEFQEKKKKGHPRVPQDRYAIAPGGRMQMSCGSSVTMTTSYSHPTPKMVRECQAVRSLSGKAPHHGTRPTRAHAGSMTGRVAGHARSLGFTLSKALLGNGKRHLIR